MLRNGKFQHRGFAEISYSLDGFSLSGKVHSLHVQPIGPSPAVQDPADEPTFFVFDGDIRFRSFTGIIFHGEPENPGRKTFHRDKVPHHPVFILLQLFEEYRSVLFQKFGMMRIIDVDGVIKDDPAIVFCVRNIDRTTENAAGQLQYRRSVVGSLLALYFGQDHILDRSSVIRKFPVFQKSAHPAGFDLIAHSACGKVRGKKRKKNRRHNGQKQKSPPQRPGNAPEGSDHDPDRTFEPLHKKRRSSFLPPLNFLQQQLQFLSRSRTLFRILRHHPADQFFEGRRNVHAELLEGRRRLAHHLGDDVEDRVPLEGPAPGNHVVHGGAQTVDVRPGVHRVRRTQLFRRRIAGRAQHRVLLGQRCPHGKGGARLGDPQVGQLYLPPGVDHDVGRLDIPVDDLIFRGCNQRLGHPQRYGDDILFGHGARFEVFFHRCTVNIFHDNVGTPQVGS